MMHVLNDPDEGTVTAVFKKLAYMTIAEPEFGPTDETRGLAGNVSLCIVLEGGPSAERPHAQTPWAELEVDSGRLESCLGDLRQGGTIIGFERPIVDEHVPFGAQRVRMRLDGADRMLWRWVDANDHTLSHETVTGGRIRVHLMIGDVDTGTEYVMHAIADEEAQAAV